MLLDKIKKAPWFLLLLPFIAVNIFSLLGLIVFFPRSYFYYEYALVLLFLFVFKKAWPSVLLFIIVFAFDLFNLFSSLFLFQLNEFFASIQFAKLYHYSWHQFLLFLLVIAFVVLIGLTLAKSQKTIQQHTQPFLMLFALIYGVIYVADLQTGLNIFNEVKQEERVNDPNNDPKNIISSLFYDYYKDLKITASEIPTILKTPSITFSSFSKDTVGNQMTIVVESWGAFADSVLQDRFQASLIHIFNKEGYGVTTGLTKYFGSTTAAGMRELTNSNGGYGYFMNPQNAQSYKSIFNYKNEQGYETFAFHPFTGRMFSRSIWWKNLGANHIYFRDNYVVEHPLFANNIDEEAHFPSVKDEAFFDYINDKTKNVSKKYVYFLTVNSHLPYKHHTQEIHPDTALLIKKLPISEEAQSQLSHIKNFIVYVAQHLKANHWDKVVIVGDHLPPFPGLQERTFYKEGKVPYLVIEKIK
jgi:hypothetical protein